MSKEFLVGAVAGISVLTTLTVEGIKKLLDEKGKTYSSNILAVIVSFVLTLISSILYIVYYAVPVTPQIIVVIICLIFLSFLTATVGYDKVKQTFEQLKKKG